jgi:outer membrane protein assembly factor BamB
MMVKKHIIGSLIIFLLLCANAVQAQTPDDSPAAREAAIARLKKVTTYKPCEDASAMTRAFGTTCNSREFAAPPILAAPKIQWEINPGWWSVWTPFVTANYVLTGSCNNETNAGLSIIDKKTGKIVWRISDICAVGNRRGSMGAIQFFELPSGEVLMLFNREDGGAADYYVISLKTGTIIRSLTTAKPGAPLRNYGTVFTAVTQSTKNGYSILSGLNTNLDKVLWENTSFRLAMPDKLDPHYQPTFSAGAAEDGLLFLSARSKDQTDPPTRQLHAIDLKTGKTLWRHTDQPVTEKTGKTAYKSDDGIPMIIDHKVIIKVQGLSGPVSPGNDPYGEGLRAIDKVTGKILWTTKAHPKQQILNRAGAGSIIVTEVQTGKEKEIWGYHTKDGKLVWRRKISNNAALLCASGGAFYVGERIVDESNKWKDTQLQGFDGETGTLLWTTSLPERFFQYDVNAPWNIESPKGGYPVWTIAHDGAIYGVTLKGAYKLK